MIALAFAVTASLGALVRRRLALWNRTLPVGTLVTNVIASFVAGLVVGSSENVVLIVGVAGLGSLSTFSAVIAETTALVDRAMARLAVVYFSMSSILGVGAALVGLVIAESL